MSRVLILLGCVLTLSAAIPDAVPLLQAAGPEARLQADYHHELLAWNRATMVEAYRQHGQRDAAWDEQAEAVLEEWAYRFLNQGSRLENPALLALASQLQGPLACPDPLVLYGCGKSFEATGNRRQAEACYRRAHAAFAGSPYPGVRKAWASARLIELAVRAGKAEAPATLALVEQMVDEFTVSLAAGDYAGCERAFIGHVTDLSWRSAALNERYRDRLATALAEHAHTWYGATVLGWIEIKRGWAARGSGWGNSVTEDGWRLFRTHLNQAQQLLTTAWELAPEQPLAATEMITVAMGSATELSERQWFDRAVAAEFDHQPAYDALMWSLRPRWGGSHQQMLALGAECADTMRYETSVPIELLDAIADIYAESKRFERPEIATGLFADPALWARAQIVLTGVISEPSRASQEDLYRSLRVALAWRFGDQDAAAAEARELGGRLDLRFIKTYDLDPAAILAHGAPLPALDDF